MDLFKKQGQLYSVHKIHILNIKTQIESKWMKKDTLCEELT